MVWGLGLRVSLGLKVHAVEGFLGLGFGLVEPGPLRFTATLRQGGGEGRWGVAWAEGGGGPAGRGFNCLWSWRTVRLRTPVSQGGYPFEAKKSGSETDMAITALLSAVVIG